MTTTGITRRSTTSDAHGVGQIASLWAREFSRDFPLFSGVAHSFLQGDCIITTIFFLHAYYNMCYKRQTSVAQGSQLINVNKVSEGTTRYWRRVQPGTTPRQSSGRREGRSQLAPTSLEGSEQGCNSIQRYQLEFFWPHRVHVNTQKRFSFLVSGQLPEKPLEPESPDGGLESALLRCPDLR